MRKEGSQKQYELQLIYYVDKCDMPIEHRVGKKICLNMAEMC